MNKLGEIFSVISATVGSELKSVDVKPENTKPTNCTTEYVKIVLEANEDLDFEIKYRYGNVKYNVKRVLHYMKDTYKPTGFLGLFTIKEPKDVYEIEIYHENTENK